jgi:hypothetical protein
MKSGQMHWDILNVGVDMQELTIGLQCVAIKTAVAFFEKLPKSTVLAVVNPY